MSQFSDGSTEVRNVLGCVAVNDPAGGGGGDANLWTITDVDGSVIKWTEGQATSDTAPADADDAVDGTGAEAIDAVFARMAEAREALASAPSVTATSAGGVAADDDGATNTQKKNTKKKKKKMTTMNTRLPAATSSAVNSSAVGGAPVHPSDCPNDGLWRLDPNVGGRVCASGEGATAMVAVLYYNGNRACYFGDGTAIFAAPETSQQQPESSSL